MARKSPQRRPPLQSALAAAYTAAALEHPGIAPREDDLAAAFDTAIGVEMSPAKRALLLHSLPSVQDIGEGALRAVHQHDEKAPRSPSAKKAVAEALSIAHLDALPPNMWRACLSWVLREEGYRVDLDSSASDPDTVVWRGDDLAGSSATIIGLRRSLTSPLSEADVRHAGDIGAGSALAAVQRLILLSNAPTTLGARLAATRQGMTLCDRAYLQDALQRAATSQAREQAQAQSESVARSRVAHEVHTVTGKALEGAVTLLVQSPTVPRATGRAALDMAIRALKSVTQQSEQAFAVWDTLIAEISAGYGDAPTGSGALDIRRDTAQWRDLTVRAKHLGDALRQVFVQLATCPAEGEFGYTAWRQAVTEELQTRCVACMARLSVVAPEHWEDYDHARPVARLEEAERAATAATRAMARRVKAYAQVAQLVGPSAS